MLLPQPAGFPCTTDRTSHFLPDFHSPWSSFPPWAKTTLSDTAGPRKDRLEGWGLIQNAPNCSIWVAFLMQPYLRNERRCHMESESLSIPGHQMHGHTLHLGLFVFETGSHLAQSALELIVQWGRPLTSDLPASISCLLGLQVIRNTTPTHFLWFWGSNTGLRACYARALPNELHLQPYPPLAKLLVWSDLAHPSHCPSWFGSSSPRETLHLAGLPTLRRTFLVLFARGWWAPRIWVPFQVWTVAGSRIRQEGHEGNARICFYSPHISEGTSQGSGRLCLTNQFCAVGCLHSTLSASLIN